ncbi:hypothetical protein [Sphaerisporangium aureirubrum]|uniref:Uncharacterized protein n=1 Tax=Sphaerisporangium aureirubrum TaxID=1544736 RepID=A0ABW1NBU8_9ACTN
MRDVPGNDRPKDDDREKDDGGDDPPAGPRRRRRKPEERAKRPAGELGARQKREELNQEDDGPESLRPEEHIAHERRERARREENRRRLLSDVDDALLGGHFNVSGHGRLYQAGRDVHYNHYDGREYPEATPLTEHHLRQLAPAHVVETDGYRRLTAHVAAGRVCLLRGSPGTGRWTAAVAGLAHAGARGAIDPRPATFPPGTAPHRLRVAALRDRTGYLVDATAAEWIRTGCAAGLRHLAHLATQANCAFVVVTDAATRVGAENSQTLVVSHRAPPVLDVFERCLCYWLHELGVADSAGRARVIAADSVVREELGELGRPREAGRLAGDIAACLAEGREYTEVLAERPQRVRQEAKSLLSEEGKGRKYERCFLLAVSVLSGQPMVTVTSAALRLAELVDAAKTTPPERDSQWSAFDETLGDWLGYAEADDNTGDDPARRPIRLRRATLGAAVLEVAWHNHPTLHGPLTSWLHRLTEDPEEAEEVRMAAAQAVGKLAMYDFAEIEREFVRAWVESASVRSHWLAAWALDTAAGNRAVATKVGALLRTWTGPSGTVRQHSAAVRAYSTTLGGMFPRDALRAVRVVTASRSRLHFEAARVLEELFRSGLRDEVVDEMDRWLPGGGQEHEVTAALALMLIAMVPEHPEGDRPALLAMFADAEADRRHQIGQLWRNALTCSEGVSRLAWDVLRLWVEHADREPAASLGPVGGLVEELSEPVGRALCFHLQWWRGDPVSPGTVSTLLSVLTTRRGE